MVSEEQKVTLGGEQKMNQYLKKEAKGALGSQAIKWNFTKFLVDRKGNVVKRFAPQIEPEKLTADIEEVLKQC